MFKFLSAMVAAVALTVAAPVALAGGYGGASLKGAKLGAFGGASSHSVSGGGSASLGNGYGYSEGASMNSSAGVGFAEAGCDCDTGVSAGGLTSSESAHYQLNESGGYGASTGYSGASGGAIAGGAVHAKVGKHRPYRPYR